MAAAPSRERLQLWTIRLAAVGCLYALGSIYRGSFFLSFLIDAVIFGLVALGLQHVVGDAGVLNLGQAAFFGLGAYGGTWTLQHWHWSTLPAVAAAIVVTLAGAVVMTPLLRLRGVYFAIASFAFGAMMFEAFEQLVSVTGGDNGLYLVPTLGFLGHAVTGNEEQYFVVLTAAVVCYAAFSILGSSGYGLSLHTIRESEVGARAAGVDVARMRVFALCLGAMPAAVAGVLYAQVHGIVQPSLFTYDESVILITMVIVGGLRSRVGAFAGALLAQYLSVYTQSLADYRLLLYGAIIAGLMIALPDGLASLLEGVAASLRVRVQGRR